MMFFRVVGHLFVYYHPEAVMQSAYEFLQNLILIFSPLDAAQSLGFGA